MKDEFLRVADRKDMIVRMLENLKGTHLNNRDDVRALAALERILIVLPDSPEHLRDLGIVLTRLDRPADARQALERYLDLAPDAADRVRVSLLLDQLEDG
jgi:regulator of sirC expression with transglutaminase-like and TPR domain